MQDSDLISFVIPVFNEEESLPELVREILEVCETNSWRSEILFVNDGSTDTSAQVIKALRDQHPEIGLIDFRRNFGKAAALNAGFRAAQGDYVVTMDGDLQDNPYELPKMLAALDNADCVSGWKVRRLDPIDKTLPSKLFNATVSKVSGIRLQDFNCGFKAYRAEAVKGLDLYGELHRFVPVLLHWQGFRVAELGVEHRARKFGRSKYGMSRLVKGFFDLMTVVLTTRFRSRPLHIFGSVGLLVSLVGVALLTYLSVLWFLGLGPIGNRPLLFLGMLMVLLGGNIIGIGLVAEFIQHTATSGQTGYNIRDFAPPVPAARKDDDA